MVQSILVVILVVAAFAYLAIRIVYQSKKNKGCAKCPEISTKSKD